MHAVKKRATVPGSFLSLGHYCIIVFFIKRGWWGMNAPPRLAVCFMLTLQSGYPSYMWKRPCMQTQVFPFNSPNTSLPAWPCTEKRDRNEIAGLWGITVFLKSCCGFNKLSWQSEIAVRRLTHCWACYLCSVESWGCRNSRRIPDTWGCLPASPALSHRWWLPLAGVWCGTGASPQSAGTLHGWGTRGKAYWKQVSTNLGLPNVN